MADTWKQVGEIKSVTFPYYEEIKMKTYNLKNDNYVYDLRSMNIYKVEGDSFPRIMREKMPEAISKIQYDIVLSNIEKFKIS